MPSGPVTSFGEFAFCLDPTRDEVYAFLLDVVVAVRAIFPETFFHVGSDEVHWGAFSVAQQQFMSSLGITTDHQLQVYFNRRFAALVESVGGRVVGWRDASHDPSFPAGSVFQYWQSRGYGNDTINSQGLYLDYLPRADSLWDTYVILFCSFYYYYVSHTPRSATRPSVTRWVARRACGASGWRTIWTRVCGLSHSQLLMCYG